MSAVKFRVGTYSQYQSLSSVDNDALYFITDAKKIFKGETEVTESIIPVDSSFPSFSNAVDGKLYVKTSTLETRIKVAGESDYIVLIPGYVSDGDDVVAGNADQIPTVNALIEYIASYVAAQFTGKTTLGAYGITDAKIENGTITLGSSTITPIPTSQKGVANGVAELDANGKVPASQLPSYVDDVIEGYYYNSKFYEESTHTTEITPASGKIYVNLESDDNQNKTYRWSGSAYVVISETLALGETASTAYRGDRGKTAYDHSQLTSGNPHNVTKSDVGLGNVTNDKQIKAINSSTSGAIVTFSGTSGDAVADSGKTIIDSGNMGDSAYHVPTANLIADAIATATDDFVTDTQFSQLSGDVDAIDTRLTTAEGNIDTLESTTSGLDTRLTTAESDISALQSAVTWESIQPFNNLE